MVVKIENLVKRYKEVLAVDHFSMEVAEGEILGLLGPNGSGKTTTINCLLSLLTTDKGTIEVFGKTMKPDAYDIKRNIGVVQQNVAVFEELTVYENIDYFCSLYVKDNATRKKLVNEVIEFVALGEYVKFYPKKLSGGLLRRLNIACGVVHKPKLIIMDEPTVAVDPQSRDYILKGIQKLNRDGATIIYTSHYMEEIEQICTRIVVIDGGKNLAQGTKEELKRMIKTGETIHIDVLKLTGEQLNAVSALPNVFRASYENDILSVYCTQGSHNLTGILDYLTQSGVEYGRVVSELPSLNDVFLELTGKKLRD